MERPEGLRRDLLHCYDLELPEDFSPRPADGEVEAFELWPIARVVQTVRDTDTFKFNVNLVLIDLFQRMGLIMTMGIAALNPSYVATWRRAVGRVERSEPIDDTTAFEPRIHGRDAAQESLKYLLR